MSFTYSSSNRLASPASGIWPIPKFRMASCAAETCPLPPSTITRSGTAPNDWSYSVSVGDCSARPTSPSRRAGSDVFSALGCCAPAPSPPSADGGVIVAPAFRCDSSAVTAARFVSAWVSSSLAPSLAPSASVSRRIFQKRRFSTSCIIAKSLAPVTPLIRKRLYSFRFGWPSTNTTIEPTADVPWMLEMS